MKATILFGAGASAFSGECSPEEPPLGHRLFDELAKFGGPASKINGKYGHIFRDNFEAGMNELSKSDGHFAIPLLREMGKYLSSFKLGRNNAYCELIRNLEAYLSNVCFATLNYDCLIEQALTLEDVKFALKPFCVDNRGPYLVKLHGSSNWLPITPENIQLNNITMCNPGATLIRGVTTPSYFSSYESICEWHDNQRFESLAPIMCNYAEGKNCMVNPEMIIEAQNFWSKTLNKTGILILIGVRYIAEDKHIWDSIDNSSCDIAVINPDRNELDLINTRYLDKKGLSFKEGFVKSITKVAELIKSYCVMA